MNLKNLKYTKDHEWVRVEGDIAYVGITDFAQGELGDIVYVEIETLNEEIEMGDVFGTVEAVKTVSDLFMPISGEIIELNDHPWFIGVQFHPEFKSRPLKPHPLFSSFIKAAKLNSNK